MTVKYTGGCHCGRVRYEVSAPETLIVSQCNCSICRKSGYLALIVPESQFRLLSGEEVLTTYRFNTGMARHHFCSYCGIKSFYRPRSHPDGISVNVRCLDSEPAMEIEQVNGREWEKQYPKGRAEGYSNQSYRQQGGGRAIGATPESCYHGRENQTGTLCAWW